MKTRLKSLVVLAAGITLALSPGAYLACGQGTAFTYQGRLTDNGSPANGNYDLRFALYDALSAGNQLGAPLTNRPVGVSNGLFTVSLDFGSGIFTGPGRWLEVGVRTNGSAGAYTLLPRSAITAVPYAITAGDVTGPNIARLNVANTAMQATGYPTVTSGFITAATVTSAGSGYLTPPPVTVNDSSGSGAAITASLSGGSVVSLAVMNAGSGYSSGATLTIGPPPSNANQTFASTNFFTSANTFSSGVNFSAASGPPFAVASAAKVSNLNADLLDGLDATAFAASSHTHFGQYWAGFAESIGLYVRNTNGDYGVGIKGESPTTGIGTGVVGVGGLYGVYGSAPNGYAGIWGTSSTATGVEGSSISGTGVSGRTTSGDSAIDGYNSGIGRGYGVRGVGGYYGVYGSCTGSNGTGVYGDTSSGSGVYGSANAAGGFGVQAYADDPAIGLLAINHLNGYGCYFGEGSLAADMYGPVTIHGPLSKPGGSFKIDHPLDPANRYLYHSFVESPDMKNIYDGVAVLDNRGEAAVTLPGWFEALNEGFRYQLTAIGAPGPNLHIAAEVAKNRFKIGGGAAGMKVSWQVTGIRKDAWANAHRIPVEEDKPLAERGSYLAPEEHGQSKDKNVQWVRYPQAKELLKAKPNQQPPAKPVGGAQ